MKHLIFYCDTTGNNPILNEIIQVGFLLTDEHFVDVIGTYSTYIKPSSLLNIDDKYLIQAGMAPGKTDPQAELIRRSVYWPSIEDAIEKISKGVSRMVDLDEADLLFAVWNADFDSAFLRHILLVSGLEKVSAETPIRSLYHEHLMSSSLKMISGSQTEFLSPDLMIAMNQIKVPLFNRNTTSALNKCEFLQRGFRNLQKSTRSNGTKRANSKTSFKAPTIRRHP